MRPLYPAVILLVLVAFFPFTVPAATDPMSFSLAISASQWKAVRLQNLPKDVQVSLAVQSDGPLSVGFLDSRDHQRFPQVGHPLFWGQLEAKLGFSVTIQEKGDYYVILDNRDGAGRRQITVTARAALGGTTAQALMAEQLKRVELQLKTLEQKLNQTFSFAPIDLHVRPCHRSQAFQRTNGLVLCLEYVRHLMESFQDKTQASDALAFSLFSRNRATLPIPMGPGISGPGGHRG